MISRRHLAPLAVGSLIAGSRSLASQPNQKSTFILVHGAWHGGWCWRDVRRILQSAGHTVFTPTLTGLGERSHLRSPSINVDTHVLDIANLINWE